MNDTSSTPSATPIPNNYGVATSMADVQNQINEMEAFFETGATLPVDFRLRQLRRMCNTYRKFKTRFLRYSFSAARKLNVRSAQLVTKYGYLVKAEIPNSRSESL